MDQPVGDESAARTRETSTISFPYLDLSDGVTVAKTIFDRAGGECTIDQLAADLSHDTVNSGAFRNKLAAARIFALIESNRESIRLTTLGYEIVEPDREKAAAAQAFLRVPLYKATFDRFRGRQLPPDVALERTFVEMGVAKKQSAKARQVFQRSADQAGFFSSGKDRLVEPSFKLPDTAPESTRPHVSAVASATRLVDAVPEIPELVAAMIKQLPPPGASFPKDRRAKWVQTLENVLELVYGSEDY